MCRFFVFIFLTISIFSYVKLEDNVNVDAKIIGGAIVKYRSQFPYQVSILKYGRHECGGSIISTRHVLTAAHCFPGYRHQDRAKYSIAAGHLKLNERNKIIKKIKYILPHNNFKMNLYNLVNDIALIEIEGSFGKWTNWVAPIKLNSKYLTGGNCKVSGWGQSRAGGSVRSDLRYANIPIMHFGTCKRFYYNYMTNEQICAGLSDGKKNACEGDSGGPLVCNNLLTGIVSYGGGCGKYPVVYTEVAKHIGWIRYYMYHMYRGLSSITLLH